jgi:hypothetical protein
MATTKGLAGVAVGWALFAGSHVAMSHPSNRRQLVDQLGQVRGIAARTRTPVSSSPA